MMSNFQLQRKSVVPWSSVQNRRVGCCLRRTKCADCIGFCYENRGDQTQLSDRPLLPLLTMKPFAKICEEGDRLRPQRCLALYRMGWLYGITNSVEFLVAPTVRVVGAVAVQPFAAFRH